MVPKYLFITGRLAAKALERCLAHLKPEFQYDITVLNCTVAAFMNTEWIAKHLAPKVRYDRIIIPGLCEGDLSSIEEKTGIQAFRGPKDLKDLPFYFGGEKDLKDYGEYKLKIIAELVNAYELSLTDILARAEYFSKAGADIIDIGCPTNGEFKGVGEVVRCLKDAGYTVSLDTFDVKTALNADMAGLDMLLSVNSQNLHIAKEINAKVVVIPDFGEGMDSLEENAAQLDKWDVPYIMDPILAPLCMGFTESINGYIRIRKDHPEAEILMGAGNLTELTDADSTGINAMIAGIAAELDIDYVLTTEVINWARGSVRELDIARRFMHYAHENHIPPKRIDNRLITVKDPSFETYTEDELKEIREGVRDRNYRIFVNGEMIYLFNRDVFISGRDPAEIFGRIDIKNPAHAFYIGRELEKAALALRLGKKYVQDEPLSWGYL